MNKKIKITLCAVLCASMLAGCADNSTSGGSAVSSDSSSDTQTTSSVSESADSSSDTSSETSSIDESKLTEEQIYSNMVERSLMDLGNLERMSKFIGKLESKQEVTIAFIGGSITEGLTAGPEKCWAKLTYDRLCEKYPDTKINYVNAGLSGTPSILGNIRLQRDVLDHKPDMVFVEFAVNDGNDQIYKDSYDAMVRKILSQENQPAVALYFTVIKSGHTCEEYMSQVGKAYSLPMVSLNNVLSHEFETGRMKWEDYSDDESHPNEWGHELVKDFVANFYTKVLDGMDGEKPISDVSAIEPLYGADYTNVHLLDRTNLTPVSLGEYTDDKDTIAQFPNGWTRKGGDNEGIVFEITCKDLFVIFHCAKNKKFAKADVYVDGKYQTSVESSKETGWGNPEAQLLFNRDKVEKHTVEFKIAEEEDNYCYFGILGFGYTD